MQAKSVLMTWFTIFTVVMLLNYAMSKLVTNFVGINGVIALVGTLLLSIALHFTKAK
jgi:hypothetical protein